MTSQSSLTTVPAMVREGLMDADEAQSVSAVADRYAVAIPPHMAGLIDRDDPEDPIALQVVPRPEELVVLPEEHVDPIGDDIHSPVMGLVHRYPDRALLKVHSACAVYCRFCFRREMVGPGHAPMEAADLDAAFDYIKAHPEIWEIILTGGDPLVLSPPRLDHILSALDAIDHVAVVRVHTRMPVAAPERITDALTDVLRNRSKALYVAVHCNHVRELSTDTVTACHRLRDAGVILLGQTVLLHGVNDDANTLDALFRMMVQSGITPYYLHHPDLAPGTSHFRVSVEHGQTLMKSLRGRLSGVALPTYIFDIPGGFGKVPAGPAYVTLNDDGSATVEDNNGRLHPYPPR